MVGGGGVVGEEGIGEGQGCGSEDGRGALWENVGGRVVEIGSCVGHANW